MNTLITDLKQEIVQNLHPNDLPHLSFCNKEWYLFVKGNEYCKAKIIHWKKLNDSLIELKDKFIFYEYNKDIDLVIDGFIPNSLFVEFSLLDKNRNNNIIDDKYLENHLELMSYIYKKMCYNTNLTGVVNISILFHWNKKNSPKLKKSMINYINYMKYIFEDRYHHILILVLRSSLRPIAFNRMVHYSSHDIYINILNNPADKLIANITQRINIPDRYIFTLGGALGLSLKPGPLYNKLFAN